MATILTVGGHSPRIHPSAFIAPNAVLAGQVEIGERASVWFGAVLRGDQGVPITVGARTSVQDNAVIHTTGSLATVIGAGVTIGHNVVMEGCVIEDGALVGMLACVLPAARVGAGALVAAGAVVREGQEIPPATLAAGVPAQVKGPLVGGAAAHAAGAAEDYQRLMDLYDVSQSGGEDG